MKKCRKTISVGVLIILAVFLLFSSNVRAADLLPLAMDFGGNFKYHDGSINSGLWSGETTADAYWLELTLNPTTILYMNGDQAGVGGVDADYLQDSNVEFVFSGRLYNADDPNNLIFGNTNNGGTGGGQTGDGYGVFFDIRDTTTNDILLSAALNNVEMEQVCTTLPPFLGGGTSCTNPAWNFNFDMNTLWGLEVDPDFATNSNTSGGPTYSRYVDELMYAINNPYAGTVTNVDISFQTLTFNGGTNAFEEDSFGTIQGKIYALPEPVSTVLFIIGGVTLAFRHFRRNKKVLNS